MDSVKKLYPEGMHKKIGSEISAERLGFYLDNANFVIELGKIEYTLAFSAEFEFNSYFEII